MSSIVKLATPLLDHECVVEALRQPGARCTLGKTTIERIELTYNGQNMSLVKAPLGYILEYRNDYNRAGIPEWLSTVDQLYRAQVVEKEKRIAEEERRRIEEEKARLRAEQERLVVEKARVMGYRLDKRAEKDGSIRLVLVRRM
ncbi:MAG TPA: hypothetical protein VMW87_05430 [Spirochaetia bacterium]|nr:hypothetical protein [Spirochaetia bacterium]